MDLKLRFSWLFALLVVQYVSAGSVFTPGNLLVTRSGTNTAVLQASNALFVDEIMLNGTLVQSIPLSCVVGNTLYWGAIQTSSDELYASVACYPGTAGTSAPSGSDRLGVSIKANSSIVTTTITSTLSLRTPYSALVVGNNLYMGTSSGVLAMATLGASAAATVANILDSVTTSPIYNLQDKDSELYLSTFGSPTPFLVATVNGGIPTTGSKTVTSLFTPSSVTPSLAGTSHNGIFVYNASEIYGTTPTYIWKATFDGSAWTATTLSTSTPANGITVRDMGSFRYVFYTLESGLYRAIEEDGEFSSGVVIRSLNSGKARYHDVTTVPNACVDGELNQDETDTDCGGTICGKCSNDKDCLSDSDCSSTYCNAWGYCKTPTCSDDVQNGLETDQDCGGPSCGSCSSGGSCIDGTDCVSGLCTEGLCIATCNDTETNQGESDVDCGGPCSLCEADYFCNSPSDCVSGVCTEGSCEATCSDGRQNQDETDVDCGGSTCDPCEETKKCVEDYDCYGDCLSYVCVPTCDDGRANQGESDVDCGGETSCSRCSANRNCTTNGDCKGDECVDGICVPNCQDYELNNGETDVDCGGSNNCTRCATGDECFNGSDCQSFVCDDEFNLCAAPTCWDGVSNGDESGTDCGGPDCSTCGAGGGCTYDSDCVSNVCEDGICQATCSDGVRNQGESDTDCGGFDCTARCSSGKSCRGDFDCKSGECFIFSMDSEFGTCVPTCDDGEQNQGETAIDCGGDNGCPRCREFISCEVDADCVSGICDIVESSPTEEVPWAKRSTLKYSIAYECKPSCTDGFLNNDEDDMDCGGPNCPDCQGLPCVDDSECTGSTCNSNGLCKFSCEDEMLNNGESDVDCGGGNCEARCSSGKTCREYSDCKSGVCTSSICQPTCDDGEKNSNETGIDCGYDSACGLCRAFQGCNSNQDCISNTCEENVCLPTCSDSVKNQDETDTDCGGICGNTCTIGSWCNNGTDCASNKCDSGVCVISCSDGVKNQDETDIDCGGQGDCPRCGLEANCEGTSDCETGLECISGVCDNPPPVAEPVSPPVEAPVEPPVEEPVSPPVDPPVAPIAAPVAAPSVSVASTVVVGAVVMFVAAILA